MVKQFKIIPDHPSVTVLSGSVVSGTVIVETSQPKKYNAIKIFLKGKGTATVDLGSPQSAWTNRERYVNLEKVLWDKSQSPSRDHVLPVGEHRFPFRFVLPSSLPSSFEGSDGGWRTRWIRYYLKAQILPGSASSHTVKLPLTVTEAIDVNAEDLDKPVRLEKQKTVGCLWCASGSITTTVEVPRTGYSIGEEIPLRVTVENGSNRRIECVSNLLQKTTYSVWQCGIKFNNHDPVLCHAVLRSQPIEPHTTSTWESTLAIPRDAAPTIDTMIIKRYFTLGTFVVIPNARNSAITIPLVVGHVQSRR